MWSVCVPYLKAEVEDGQGDRREEDGGAPLPEVERDGRVQLRAAAAPCVRHLQELRGPLPRGVHGRQRRGHARKSYLVREKGRWRWRRRQKEVSRARRVGGDRRQRLN